MCENYDTALITTWFLAFPSVQRRGRPVVPVVLPKTWDLGSSALHVYWTCTSDTTRFAQFLAHSRRFPFPVMALRSHCLSLFLSVHSQRKLSSAMMARSGFSSKKSLATLGTIPGG